MARRYYQYPANKAAQLQHDLTITIGIRNGDGIDPGFIADCSIFNCTLDTGDDCIAIKSGEIRKDSLLQSRPPTPGLQFQKKA